MKLKNSSIAIMIAFVFGMITAVSSFAEEQAATAAAPSPKSASADTNKDGKADQWQYYENGQVARTEADTNFDGKADEIGHFSYGKLTKLEKDSDYDGEMDKWVEY